MDRVVLVCEELSTVQLWKQQCWAPAQVGRRPHLLLPLQFVQTTPTSISRVWASEKILSPTFLKHNHHNQSHKTSLYS